MKLIEMPVGKVSDVNVDCIKIEEQPNRSFQLTGTAMCSAGDQGGDSVSLMDGMVYATAEEAKQTGLAWAETIGVERLYIMTGTLAAPLEMTEMDLPA